MRRIPYLLPSALIAAITLPVTAQSKPIRLATERIAGDGVWVMPGVGVRGRRVTAWFDEQSAR